MPVIQVGPLALPVYPLALILGGWLGLEVSARGGAAAGAGRRSHLQCGLCRADCGRHRRQAGARGDVLVGLSQPAAGDHRPQHAGLFARARP